MHSIRMRCLIYYAIYTGQRILKLLFHKIRPIFVFDGATPVLKLRTIRIRKLIHERNVCAHCVLLTSYSISIPIMSRLFLVGLK